MSAKAIITDIISIGGTIPKKKKRKKARATFCSGPESDWSIIQFSPHVGEDNVYKDNMICTSFVVIF